MSSYVYSNTPMTIVKEGDYEAIIERIEKVTLSTGTEKLSVKLRIRNDVEGQSFGNRIIFDDIWKERKNPEFFNRVRINKMLGTQDVKEGTEFEDIDKIINFLVGCYVIIHVGITHSEYKDEDVNVVKYYKTSKLKPKVVTEDDVIDEDLPF